VPSIAAPGVRVVYDGSDDEVDDEEEDDDGGGGRGLHSFTLELKLSYSRTHA
jgi:hypothetical protein